MHQRTASLAFQPVEALVPATMASSAVAGAAPQRLILLLGTARSGTSWLGTALRSYERVVYSHEPLSRLRTRQVMGLVGRINNVGFLSREERVALLREWCKANTDCRRPPFFRKDFFRVPPSLHTLGWLLVRLTGCGTAWYGRWFTPPLSGDYDLLVKEIDWGPHCESIVRALNPELVILVRHPCAVVASLLRGQRLGLMAQIDPACWYLGHESACAELGFSRAAVLRMTTCELLTVNWLVQNSAYRNVLQTQSRGLLVVYEKLCRDPLNVLQGIFASLHWEMGKQTRTFLEKSRQERTPRWRGFSSGTRASYFGVTRRRQNVVASWKTDLAEVEQHQVLTIARRLPDFDLIWPG